MENQQLGKKMEHLYSGNGAYVDIDRDNHPLVVPYIIPYIIPFKEVIL